MWPADQTRSGRGGWKLIASCALLLALLLSAGCALFAPPQVSISGRVSGVPLLTSPAKGLARAPEPLPATVRCNKSQVTAAKTGVYTLRVDQANQYTCTISATNYLPVTVTLAGSVGNNLTLNLGPVAGSDPVPCVGQVTTASITCSPLQLRPAKLYGAVVSADSQQPVGSTVVTCWQPGTGATPSVETASTGAAGTFTVTSAPPGVYACRAGSDPTLYTGTVDPGGSA